MTEMTHEAAAALRAPFPAEAIGKLPKPTKKDNPKGRCDECGGYHGLPAVHLDYVGHAATTDRLLQVDPCWTWEPMVVGPNGEPLIVNGGLWINLTVCGVTRPGFGDATGSGGMKEMIGDAIRNAAMRFGVALDLWSKQDLHDMAHPEEPQEGRRTATGATDTRRAFDPAVDLMDGAITGRDAAKRLGEAMLGIDPTVDWHATVAEATWRTFGKVRDDLDANETREFWTRLSNAVARVQETAGTDGFPPPDDTVLSEAFVWAFGLTGEFLVTLNETVAVAEEAIAEEAARAASGDTVGEPAPQEGGDETKGDDDANDQTGTAADAD